MSEQNEQLLPCPFCGGANLQIEVNDGVCDYVMCGSPDRDGCGVMVSRIDCEGDPREAWNHRAQPAPTVQAEPGSAPGQFLTMVFDMRQPQAVEVAKVLHSSWWVRACWSDAMTERDEARAAPAHASSDGRDAKDAALSSLRNTLVEAARPHAKYDEKRLVQGIRDTIAALAGTGVKGGETARVKTELHFLADSGMKGGES